MARSMQNPILLGLVIIGIMLAYYFFIKPRTVNETEFEKCYKKCSTPVIGNSPEDCERFCEGNHELRSKTIGE